MRGQVLSVDFVMSLLVFIFILTTSVLIWNNINSQIDQNERNNRIQSELSSISTTLIESPGSPTNWETLPLSQVNQIGLAVRSNVLSPAKITALTTLDIDDRNILGFDTGNVYIEFVDVNNNLLKIDGEDLKFGTPPLSADLENVYKISRAIIVDENEPVIGIMNVIVW